MVELIVEYAQKRKEREANSVIPISICPTTTILLLLYTTISTFHATTSTIIQSTIPTIIDYFFCSFYLYGTTVHRGGANVENLWGVYGDTKKQLNKACNYD